MKQFEPATPILPSEAQLREIAATFKITYEAARDFTIENAARSNLYRNDVYQVDVRAVPKDELPGGWPPMTWLSIKRIDRAPVGEERFRDFQEIKNMLCGPEWEAVEIYPQESRLVDTANQYHLWAINGRFPFGFDQRIVQYESTGGAVQKPLTNPGAK